MKESLKIAVPWRWFAPIESNMMPPRLGPSSWRAAKNTQSAHCGTLAKRDQYDCIASCISVSLQTPSAPESASGTLSPLLETETSKPARR